MTGITFSVFIDASGDDHFIKVGNQNELRDSDVEEIINTYRNREEKEKYSYLASLKEIAENDYNLNIPRYVDTFEEEESVDINAVMQEIKTLEAKRSELDTEINGYFQELGLVFS
ncbi:N-6 DNA methylase [Plebeiibacterium marinum]|uniref:N-6 DNA methylase n=1 Tax=Plebeiibacterium marinum TaxID=2992111 RepID=UPI00263ADC99|nr:N-6 DNA methylase [Plebeiobacterium marinum]